LTSVNDKVQSGKKIPVEINGFDSVLTSKEKIKEKEGSLYFVFNWCVVEIFLLKIELLFCYFFQFLFQGFYLMIKPLRRCVMGLGWVDKILAVIVTR
jgi:hypothetical protein